MIGSCALKARVEEHLGVALAPGFFDITALVNDRAICENATREPCRVPGLLFI